MTHPEFEAQLENLGVKVDFTWTHSLGITQSVVNFTSKSGQQWHTNLPEIDYQLILDIAQTLPIQ